MVSSESCGRKADGVEGSAESRGPFPMKRFIQRFLGLFGFEIRRCAEPCPKHRPERGSLEGSLEQIRDQGFVPETVIDVGAAIGTFSRTCHALFPSARYVLIEPLEEYRPCLEKVVGTISRATYEIAVAASSEGTVTMNVHDDLVGSSLYREQEVGTNVNGAPRQVRAITLDQLIHAYQLRPPFLLKVDVQGAELEVLRGGEVALAGAEYVLLEVSLFEFFEHGPQFCDVVSFMHAKGFVPYDILGLQHRPLDRALSQVDIAFVKESGCFRQRHCYATSEQRRQQNDQFRSYLESLLSAERAP